MERVSAQCMLFPTPLSKLAQIKVIPRSKFMVPIDSAPVVCYSTSIDTIIVSVTSFAIFDVQL